MNARKVAASHGKEIGCGDNSCIFGPPGGMGTNGGCRCPGIRHTGSWTPDEQWQARHLIRVLADVLNAVGKGYTAPAPVEQSGSRVCTSCKMDPDPRGPSACYACRKLNGLA